MAHIIFLPCAVVRCCQQAIRTHECNNPVCSTTDSTTDMQQRHRNALSFPPKYSGLFNTRLLALDTFAL